MYYANRKLRHYGDLTCPARTIEVRKVANSYPRRLQQGVQQPLSQRLGMAEKLAALAVQKRANLSPRTLPRSIRRPRLMRVEAEIETLICWGDKTL